MTTDAVWAAFSSRLRGFIAKRVRGEADIDDVLQEVFAKVHAGLPGLRDGVKLEAWLFGVARRAVVDHVRGRKRRAAGLPERGAPESDVAAEVASWLAPMMSALPEEDREALRLADLEGMDRKALAARLGMSVTGAKSRVQRARARLKGALLECCHLEMDRLGRPVDYVKKRGDCGACSCS